MKPIRQPLRPCKECGLLSAAQTCLNPKSGKKAWPPHAGRALDTRTPRVCPGFQPCAEDPDQRSGRQLWAEIHGMAERAELLLLQLLGEGPRPASALMAAGIASGISRRTIQRAAGTLGVRRRKSGLAGGWVWALP